MAMTNPKILDLDALTDGALEAVDPPKSQTITVRAFNQEWTAVREIPLMAELGMAASDLTADAMTNFVGGMVIPSERSRWLSCWSQLNGVGAEQLLMLVSSIHAAIQEAGKATPAAKRKATAKKVAATRRTTGSARR